MKKVSTHVLGFAAWVLVVALTTVSGVTAASGAVKEALQASPSPRFSYGRPGVPMCLSAASMVTGAMI